ncbi:MAG: 16S rRNA (cytosine(1402)-N(4))-methyltransferase RsmH [Pseudomonadota bacterium]
MGHIPVLLEPVLEALAPEDGEVHLDATFGGGGYARALLAAADCVLLAIDRDPAAIARAEDMAKTAPGMRPLLGRFGALDELAIEAGHPALDGVVLDLGVSSFQIDEAERGFSFQKDGPLDMRMAASGPSAADILNQIDEANLATLIFRLGEERASRRVARAIVERRAQAPFSTTADLAEVVSDALGGRRGARTHPATKVFQAVRIYVNDELGELSRALLAAERILRPGGRLVLVTFHSLEDRAVKRFLRARTGAESGPSRHMPGPAAASEPTFELISRKAIIPSDEERRANPRARSAKLRAARRTAAAPRPADLEPAFNLPPLSQFAGRP